MNYNEAKLHQLNAVSTYRVYGNALEFDQGEGDGAVARKGWTVVNPCLCVQDSPQNPCPCDKSIVWWLREDAVIRQGGSGRKDHRGKELQFFDVLVESTIMVESLQPVKASTLKGLGTNLTLDELRNLTAGTSKGSVPGIMLNPIRDIIIGIIATMAYEAAKDSGVLDSIEDYITGKKGNPPK